MRPSSQETLRFLPVEGRRVRGEFDGSALSADFGPLLLWVGVGQVEILA